MITKVDFTKASALAPGNEMKIFTLGGAISGNWEIGRVVIASTPKKTIASDMAIAKTGLCMNLLNICCEVLNGFRRSAFGNQLSVVEMYLQLHLTA
jgi:hypothetical protein